MTKVQETNVNETSTQSKNFLSKMTSEMGSYWSRVVAIVLLCIGVISLIIAIILLGVGLGTAVSTVSFILYMSFGCSFTFNAIVFIAIGAALLSKSKKQGLIEEQARAATEPKPTLALAKKT